MQQQNSAQTFSGGVVVLFGTQVFGAALGIFSGILLARLLGPEGKGDYYILVLLPATAMVLLQLGLPQAFNFFTARRRTAGIVTKAFALTAVLTVAAVLGLALLLPLLSEAMLQGVSVEQVLVVFIAFPQALLATLATGIVLGRQAVRWYAGVTVAHSIASTIVLVVVLGWLGPSVNNAIAVYLIATAIQAAGFAVAAVRVTRAASDTESASYRDLLGYGLRFYPGSLTGFFNYRADAFLIALLIADASPALGYYSMAVGLAELVFFFPRAVSTLFFPHVAGSSRESSDQQVATVARVTFLVTGAVAVLLVPAAAVMIWLVLPAFEPSLVPLLLLLPGVVSLSAANIVGSYLRGIGKPGTTSFVSLVSLVVNIVANIILIPLLGIVGAAAASLVSYGFLSLLLTTIAGRITGTPVGQFWVPRLDDVGLVLTESSSLLRRARYRALGSSPGSDS